MVKKRILLYVALLSITTIFMGIGYASINNITLDLNGLASAKKNNNLEITNVTYLNDNLADKTKSKINGYSATVLNSTVVLGSDTSSTLTYEVTLTNDTDYTYQYVDTIYDEEFYDNTNITYEISGITSGEIISKNTEKKITITFKYTSEDITNTTLNSYLNIKFNKVYSIEYKNITNNNYPNLVIDGSPVSITFTSDIPNSIEIDGDADYEYNNGILKINNIKSDLVIKNINTKILYITSGNNLTLGSTIDTSSYNTDEANAPSTYMKYTVDNNIITQTDICKKATQNAKAVCLVGADPSKYNSNKEIILAYFGGNNTSIPSECNEENNSGATEFTCANNYVVLAADSRGGISINNKEDSTSCIINPESGTYSCH